MKKLLDFKIILYCTFIVPNFALADTPFPLTPKWFHSLYDSLQENQSEVWRGRVIDVQNPTTIVIENTDTLAKVQVKLLHLTQKANPESTNLDLQMTFIRSFLNREIYVLSDPKKPESTAKLIDSNGSDLNLNLVKLGIFDIDETSLSFHEEKASYITQRNNAKKNHLGIWK